jgi:manganese oxidase
MRSQVIVRPDLLRTGALLGALLVAVTLRGMTPTPLPASAAEAPVRLDFDVARLSRTVEPREESGRVIWTYELTLRDGEIRLQDGTPYKIWGFNGQSPGPTLLAREGDWVRIRLVNETSVPHTIHSHGLWVPNRMDGVPHALGMHHPVGSGGGEMPSWTQPVQPGESFVYEYIARPAGTHFYHCHVNTNEHLDRGMSGALIVLPRQPDPEVDHDRILILDEWNSRYARGGVPGNPRETGDYDFFTINGKSFPATDPLPIGMGEVVRLRLINAGAQSHSMHFHGHTFLVVQKDGRPLPEPVEMDTVAIAPGERFDLLILADNAGTWCFHCHTAAHVTNAGSYPGGMLMHIQVGQASFPNDGDGPVGGPGLEAIRTLWGAPRPKR